ncbi:MAG: segregation/condensation protein A [Candidatus Sungbacteria bacterium]|nr:segregation/condensation protein A [Candidatus Sungbacteria bacterium]
MLKRYVKQEKFEGPLDLLLALIEKRELQISEISLAAVTDDYLSEVRQMEVVDGEALAEFLVIAAQLMLVKSRSLLPQFSLTDEEEESIGDLEARLREYKRIRELAKALKELERRAFHIEARSAFIGLPQLFYPPPKFPLSRLSEVFGALVKTLPQLPQLLQEKLKKIISLEEKIREIQGRLKLRFHEVFSDLVKNSREKVEIIVSFLAILELAKQQLVSLEQDDRFGEIRIRKSNDERKGA